MENCHLKTLPHRRLHIMNFRAVIYAIFLSMSILVSSAEAYIDPNTGGLFFQTVAPFVYAILGVVVVFWKRITGFVKGLFGGKKDHETPPKNV